MNIPSDFFLSSKDFEPAYLKLYGTGELMQRAQQAIEGLAPCEICPRACHENRLLGETGICKTGRYAEVISYFPHHGEEASLRGILVRHLFMPRNVAGTRQVMKVSNKKILEVLDTSRILGPRGTPA